MQSPRNAPSGRGVHSDETVETRAGDPDIETFEGKVVPIRIAAERQGSEPALLRGRGAIEH